MKKYGFRLIIAATFTALASISDGNAQQIIPPGQMIIGGAPFVCGQIPTAAYPQMNDIASAGGGFINLNWPLFSAMPPAVQAYIYGHECAHYIFGPDENASDCWSVKTGRNQGYLNIGSLQQICASVYFSPGDWTHAPGPLRCQNMMACFSQP